MASTCVYAQVLDDGSISINISENEVSNETVLYLSDDVWYREEKVSIALTMMNIRDRTTAVKDMVPHYSFTQIHLRQDIPEQNHRCYLNISDLSVLTRRYMEYLADIFPGAEVYFECSDSWRENRINMDIVKGSSYPMTSDTLDTDAIKVGDYVCAKGMARATGTQPFIAPWRWLNPCKVTAVNANWITVVDSKGAEVEYSRRVIEKFHPITYTPVAGGRLVCLTAPGRKIPLYSTSTAVDSTDSINTSSLYFYDGKVTNNKYRVVTDKADVNRTPAIKYSVGWVYEDDLSVYGITQMIED